MDKELFKQFKKHFGDEWSCSCGSSFEGEWLEVKAQTENALLARYICQVCGREQFFAIGISSNDRRPKGITEIPVAAISSDDVLDIKDEISKINFNQIKSLTRKKVVAKTPATKSTER